ncbi:TPA: type II methionyl aminopeptidase [Candidatus Woesearchaeota archaeon]|nr:type II methionyl aminopeptidase [Candidatus Woesearchaeota archaeon]
MDDETRQRYIRAGRISAEALEYGKGLIKKGNSLLETTELIEKKIPELGGKPAFPVQISCDHIAAHYCPEQDDSVVFGNQLVSLDLGVHVDGAVGDTAYTIDLSGNYPDAVKAAQQALAEALKIVGVGVTLGEIGKAIQDTIAGYGLAPVRNLSGHGIDIYNIHTEPTVPNCDTHDKTALRKGQVIAIEPFATTGLGMVQESGAASVFMLVAKKPVRNPITREVLRRIESYEGLPFCRRWLVREFGQKTNYALRELAMLGMIEQFPPLVEVKKGVVAQAEHTVLIEEEPVVLTRL